MAGRDGKYWGSELIGSGMGRSGFIAVGHGEASTQRHKGPG